MQIPVPSMVTETGIYSLHVLLLFVSLSGLLIAALEGTAMVDKRTKKDTKALTSETGFEDNRGSKKASSISPHIDPRIVSLVRLLARKAAERDFARFARQSESGNPRPGKN